MSYSTIKLTMCYSTLLILQSKLVHFDSCISKTTYTAPNFAHEGMAGFIETHVEFEVFDLLKFAQLLNNAEKANSPEFYREVLEGKVYCG